jgi:hypothetical protein
MGFLRMSIGKKPAVGNDVPAFQTSATFTFRQDFSAAGAIQFSMLGQRGRGAAEHAIAGDG